MGLPPRKCPSHLLAAGSLEIAVPASQISRTSPMSPTSPAVPAFARTVPTTQSTAIESFDGVESVPLTQRQQAPELGHEILIDRASLGPKFACRQNCISNGRWVSTVHGRHLGITG